MTMCQIKTKLCDGMNNTATTIDITIFTLSVYLGASTIGAYYYMVIPNINNRRNVKGFKSRDEKCKENI